MKSIAANKLTENKIHSRNCCFNSIDIKTIEIYLVLLLNSTSLLPTEKSFYVGTPIK